MLGAIIGDIIGSRFEFDRGNKSREFELFTSQCEFTDDTVMTIAVAEALMDAGKDADEKTVKAKLIASMKKWGRKYPDSGYGARFIDWVLSDDPQPYGSFGNGSGMRVSPVGWFYDSLERTREVARWTAEVTHNHPEGIKGAESTASAIYLARNNATKEEIKKYIEKEFGYDLSRTLDKIRPTYHHVEDCMHTMPEAFECFLEANKFEEAIRNVMYIGGDTDTLAAITGSIAEAFWHIPPCIAIEANRYLSDDIQEIIEKVRNYTDGACPNVNLKSGFDCPVYGRLVQEDEELIRQPSGECKLVKKNRDEDNYFQMSSDNYERPAQIPIRYGRLDYLLNEYSSKETDRWIMFSHPNHFVIYDRKTRFCIYDAEYTNFENQFADSEPICAVIEKIRINKDPEQHPGDIEDDFCTLADLLERDL